MYRCWLVVSRCQVGVLIRFVLVGWVVLFVNMQLRADIFRMFFENEILTRKADHVLLLLLKRDSHDSVRNVTVISYS